jgi:hypothetical protein
LTNSWQSFSSRAETEEILQQIGRLIAYTRQLDAILDSDDKVAELTRNFLAGDYRVG